MANFLNLLMIPATFVGLALEAFLPTGVAIAATMALCVIALILYVRLS